MSWGSRSKQWGVVFDLPVRTLFLVTAPADHCAFRKSDSVLPICALTTQFNELLATCQPWAQSPAPSKAGRLTWCPVPKHSVTM